MKKFINRIKYWWKDHTTSRKNKRLGSKAKRDREFKKCLNKLRSENGKPPVEV